MARLRAYLALLAALAACDLVPDAPAPDAPREPPPARSGGAGGGGEAASAAAAERGELVVLSWNLEWFMDPERGPADEDRQLNGARSALVEIGADVMALQEIGSEDALSALLAALPGYQGVLSSYDSAQRLALVFHGPFELTGVSEIGGFEAAGRPPLEVALRDARDDSELLVVVVHAKAFADAGSWQRRARFAEGLHAYLERQRAGAAVVIAGDFNDGLLSSTAAGRGSPYAVFTSDPGYLAPTAELERAGLEGSTAQDGALLDHILLGAVLEPRLVPGSADVLRDEMLARNPSFSATVSDHFPVVVRLR